MSTHMARSCILITCRLISSHGIAMPLACHEKCKQTYISMVCSPAFQEEEFECIIIFCHVLHFYGIIFEPFGERKNLPFLSSVCCHFLIGLKLFPLFHFLTHAAGSCFLACFCSCKNQIQVFSTIKAQLWEDGESTYVISSNSCINGSRAIKVLSIKKNRIHLYFSPNPLSATFTRLQSASEYELGFRGKNY